MAKFLGREKRLMLSNSLPATLEQSAATAKCRGPPSFSALAKRYLLICCFSARRTDSLRATIAERRSPRQAHGSLEGPEAGVIKLDMLDHNQPRDANGISKHCHCRDKKSTT